MALLSDLIERAFNRSMTLGLLSLTAPPYFLIKLFKISNLIDLGDIFPQFPIVLEFLELRS